MTDMLAYRAEQGAKEAELRRVPVPDVTSGDVLVKIHASSVVPGVFTLMKQGMLRQAPTTLGHEGAGVVSKVGVGVHDIKEGDRVRIHPTMSCGRCAYCLTGRDAMCPQAAMVGFIAFGPNPVSEFREYHQGCLAEYVRVPARYVYKLPDNVSFEVGAKVHYLANAIRCMKVAELRPGSTVMIFAATGTMGVSAIKLARYFGISRLVLVARSKERLEPLKALTDIPVDCIATNDLPQGEEYENALRGKVAQVLPRGAEAILDFAPHGSNFWPALSGLATDGTYAHMGGAAMPFPVPLVMMMRGCWRVVTTRNHSREDARLALDLLSTGRLSVDELVSHRFTLDRVDDAVRIMSTRSDPMWWSIVNP